MRMVFKNKQSYYPDQYSKGVNADGLNVYCNCNDCTMYINSICKYLKSPVSDPNCGCAHAIIKKLLKNDTIEKTKA